MTQQCKQLKEKTNAARSFKWKKPRELNLERAAPLVVKNLNNNYKTSDDFMRLNLLNWKSGTRIKARVGWKASCINVVSFIFGFVWRCFELLIDMSEWNINVHTHTQTHNARSHLLKIRFGKIITIHGAENNICKCFPYVNVHSLLLNGIHIYP